MESFQEAFDKIKHRHNVKSTRGLSLRNATGDIDQSTLGFQIAIDTLTYIKKQVTEQKFYEISPVDYVPIAVGEGAFQQNILTNLVINAAGDFEAGNINQGTANDRLAAADVGIASKTIKVINWAKATGYTVFEIEQALQANNWDVIEAKHKARKKNWDLGIQKIAFVGSATDPGVLGLLTQTSANINTTTITGLINTFSATQFAALVQNLVAAYQSNCAYTAYPTHFVIPQDDWLGLATPVSSSFPFNSMLEYLKKAFDEIVPGGIKIIPNVYGIGSSVYGGGSIGHHRYAMYRYDPESIRMDIPVDFTVTQPNTYNNFQFQDAAYAQYTGVLAYRQLELLYFDLSS